VKINVTYIISDIHKAIAFEWIVEKIDKDKVNLSFILINCEPSYLLTYLLEKKMPVYSVNCENKKNIPFAIYKCCFLLNKLKPKVVHCHLFLANLIGLTAAKIMGIKHRVYTRHHSDYHHIYYPKTVKWDKYCNILSTQIISISDIVSYILINKEGVPEKKIVKISHGFDLKAFTSIDNEEVSALRSVYNPANKYPVIGVISRFVDWKGIQYIIPAYNKLLKHYPDSLLLLFNASGGYEKEVNGLLEKLPEDSFKKVVFENNITSLYRLFDMFVHVPISSSVEAFGQIYVESMLSEVVLIATKSGVGNEIMVNRNNCMEVPYENSNVIYESMIEVLQDKELSKKIRANAKLAALDKFSIERMILLLEKLYLQ
jgi:glycosyltransferase involved in cell wall biosynthesis